MATAPPAEISAAGTWDVALHAARALEAPYCFIYQTPSWPNLSLHYATMAKLEMLLGRPRRASRVVGKAMVGLEVTHDGRGRGGGAGGGGGGGREGVMDQVGREAGLELSSMEQGIGGGGVRHEDDFVRGE